MLLYRVNAHDSPMSAPAYLLRPVRENDFDEIYHLVGTIGDGLTSLPKDSHFLAHRINDSLRAFDPRIHKPGGETYLFVLEETKSGKIVGTSGILSRVGGFDPFYTYRIRQHLQEYAPLAIRIELATLHLTRSHKGPTEICSLFLHQDHRKSGLGKLLSLPRFCFIKAFPERFDKEILAELRGFIDAEGKSPFWEAVGKQFFGKDYYTADILSGVGEKDFIEALMPKYPIYISLLPPSAREVIGRVHPHTEPARKILLREGFRETDEVDIFDAGPILKTRIDQLSTWKDVRVAVVAAGDPDDKGLQALLTNASLDFRAILATVTIGKDGNLTTTRESLEALNLNPGDSAQYTIIR